MATVRESGGDYSTLAAACTAGETVIDIEGTWTAPDTTAVTINTSNTTITADADSKHGGFIEASPSYYRLRNTGSSHCITVAAAGTVIDGIVIERGGTAQSSEAIRYNGGQPSDALTVKNCIIYCLTAGQAAQQDGIYIGDAHGTINLEQTIIMGFARCGINLQPFNTGTGGRTQTLNLNSCTIAHNGHDTNTGDQAQNGGVGIYPIDASTVITINAHNCLVVDNDQGAINDGAADFNSARGSYASGTQAWNISNTIISDDSYTAGRIQNVSGANQLANRSWTDSDNPGAGDWVIFEQYTTYPFDVRLKDNAADNDAQDNHADAGPTHGLTIPALDIVGTARPQNTLFDIGVFEVAPSGPVAATVRESGGDYSTLAAACAAGETDISIEGTWTAADTTAVTISTADTTITADADSKHSGFIEASPSYYRLEVSSGHCITVNADNLNISGIVVHLNGAGASDECFRVNNTGCTASELIVYGRATFVSDQDGFHIPVRGKAMTLTVTQCVIFNFRRGGIHTYPNGANDHFIVNSNSNTFFNCGQSGETRGGALTDSTTISGNNSTTYNVHNTLVLDCGIGNDNADYNEHLLPLTWNISNSTDSDGSIALRGPDSGAGNLGNRSSTDNASPGAGDWVIFNDVTTYPYDLRLADNATDNDAQDAHSNATAHSLTIPALDIAGNPRPDDTLYDIGVFEVVSSGAPPVIVTPDGVGATGAPGTLGAVGAARIALLGVSGIGGVGDPGIVTGARVIPDGVFGTGAVGAVNVIVETDLTVLINGVAATPAAGDVEAIGAAIAALTGVSTTGAVGTPLAVAGAKALISGVSAIGELGDLGFETHALFELAGAVATGAVGSVIVQTETGQVVLITGVAGIGAAGDPAVVADANVLISGVLASGEIGDMQALGRAMVTLDGLVSDVQLGGITVIAEGGVSITISGVGATGGAGTLAGTGSALFNISGVSGTGIAGDVAAVVSELVQLAGVEATAAAGVVDHVIAALIDLQSVSAIGQVGRVTIPLPADQAGELVGTITISVALTNEGLNVTPSLGGKPVIH